MNNTPHIFLDSNIFYTDPFQNNSFNAALINLSNSSNLKLYISDVVYEESIENYRKNLAEKFNNFNKATEAINKLSFNKNKIEIASYDDLIPTLIEKIDFL